MSRTLRLCIITLLAIGVAQACTDTAPTGPAGSQLRANPADNAVQLATLACTASVKANTVSCEQQSGSSGGKNAIIFGRQNVYVKLTSSNVAYTSVDSAFKFDVTVQNLIAQSLGTTNGTTPHARGVEVLFSASPTASLGSGTITVLADSVATFTAAGQPFYRYAGGNLGADGILSQNETSSARQWTLKVPSTVTTFTFALLVSTEVKFPNGWIDIATPPQPFMLSGGNNQTLSGTVRDFSGASVGGTIKWSSGDATVVGIVDSTAGIVQSINPGFSTITATSGARTGTVKISVCPNLAVGGTYQAGPGKAAELCFAGFGSGAEYVYMPIDTSQATAMTGGNSLNVTGNGITPVAGPPSPDVAPVSGGLLAVKSGPSALPAGFETTIASDIPYMHQDDPRIIAAMADPALRRLPTMTPGDKRLRLTIQAGNLNVGDSVRVITDAACPGSTTSKKGYVKSKGAHLIVVADTTNPTPSFSQAQYDSITAEFDTLVYATDTANFGGPTDIDSNGHVIAFFTRDVNALSPPASGSVVLGFFASKDLFPTGTCNTSNFSEIFYMLVPDPSGTVNSNVRSNSFVRSNTVGTLGHEFQHLINAARRLYINSASSFEEGFLNEGLSHIAEELIFYKASGLTPKSNITLATLTSTNKITNAYNTFASNNIGRLIPWLARPDTAGATKQNQNSLAVRGAIWYFLRYAADRKNIGDQPFFYSLVNNNFTGTANIDNAIGAATRNWLYEFTTSVYADDAVTGAAFVHQEPSWNMRSIFGPGGLNSGVFPLGTRPLSNGVLLNVGYSQGGSTTYDRFAVAASQFATLSTTGGTTKWTLVVMRTK